jgi:site-specific recombinase XerD
MEVHKAVDRYLRYHRAEGSSPKTLDWHRLSLSQFIHHLSTAGHSGEVEDVCAEDLRAYLDTLREKGLAQSSVASKVRSVKAWGKWLVAEEYLHRDPFSRVKQPRTEDKAKETLTPEEVSTLLGTCNRKTATGARDFAIMLLLYSTGLRASELLALREEDIDQDRGLIVVRRGKGGKFRMVPLGRPAEKALTRYLGHPRRKRFGTNAPIFLTDEGEALGLNGLQLALQRRGKDAGIHANPHKFRHSAAVQYLRGGGRVEALRTMLGHSTLEMTLHYARIAGVDLAAAHEIADPARSLKVRV